MKIEAELSESHVPFCRRWHVIDELDLVRLTAEHADVERLCASLEEIADALPGRPSGPRRDAVCDALESVLPMHDRREDQLLEAMFRRELSAPLTQALLKRAHSRHTACAVQAQDLIAALRPGKGDLQHHSDTLGYMLRCFFDGCRQAMAFEELAILALAGERLTPAARTMLIGRLAANLAD